VGSFRQTERLALSFGGSSLLALGIAVILRSALRFVDAAVQKDYISGELMWFATAIEATLSLLLGAGLLIAGAIAVRARPRAAAVALGCGALVCLGVAVWLRSLRHVDPAFWPGAVAAIAFASLSVWLIVVLLAASRPGPTPRSR
jgi:hypothetical protein